MAYRAYQPDRRSRRRRWLLIILTLIAVVAIIALLVTRQTEQRGTTAFFAAADEASMLHAEAADELELLLSQIGSLLPRQEVTRRLAAISATATEADELLVMDVPPVVGTAYGSMSAASQSWAAGVAEVERVIVAIMDGTLDDAPERQLAAALDTLGIGDVGYDQFLDHTAALVEITTVPDFGTVAYVRRVDADPFTYDAQNLVLKILAAYNLSPQTDLGVIGMTVPEPVGDRGGIPLVPFADALSIQAVVSNVGNIDETDVTAEMTVLNVDSGATISDSMVVGELAAGASTTVNFANLAIEPGGLYQTTITVTIPGDTRTGNNEWSMTFIWNDES